MKAASSAIATTPGRLRPSIALALLAGVVALTACSARQTVSLADIDVRPGALFEAQRVRAYPAWYLRLGLRWSGLPGDYRVTHGVRMYRIGYWTRTPGGGLVRASGMVAVPDAPPRATVGYFHGTRTDRAFAPSAPSIEGILVAAVFGGAGYAVVAPDYQGFGAYIGPHPFLHAESAAHTMIDALQAARELAFRLEVVWRESLLFAGVSQGAHAALATQRALESVPVEGASVLGTAAISGPYDLAGRTFPHALEGHADSHPVYLGYMVDSYARIYGGSRGSVLVPPYGGRVVELFDGRHDDDAVDAVLPDTPRAMFRSDVLSAPEGRWLFEALEANRVDDWTPQAPVRLFYGRLDRDVSPEEAVAAAQRLGGAAHSIDLGEVDHDDSGIAAIEPVLAWFDQLTP